MMKNTLGIASALLAWSTAGTGMAAAATKVSTDKTFYLTHEPVYLSISPDPSGPGWGPSPLETGEVVLEITPPAGDVYFYRPPLTACPIGRPSRVAGEAHNHTLVLSGGRIVTAAAGTYGLRLLDADLVPQGPPAYVEVREPDTPEDRAALRIIARSPGQYGLFHYLEGGDHLVDGLEIFERLARLDSTYSPGARAVLAINYGRSVAFGRDGRPRPSDPERMEVLLVEAFDRAPAYLQARMLLSARRGAGGRSLSPAVQGKLRQAARAWSGRDDLLKSRLFRNALED